MSVAEIRLWADVPGLGVDQSGLTTGSAATGAHVL
jgi:hypothetical protein